MLGPVEVRRDGRVHHFWAGELGGTYNEPAEWYLQLTAHFK